MTHLPCILNKLSNNSSYHMNYDYDVLSYIVNDCRKYISKIDDTDDTLRYIVIHIFVQNNLGEILYSKYGVRHVHELNSYEELFDAVTELYERHGSHHISVQKMTNILLSLTSNLSITDIQLRFNEFEKLYIYNYLCDDINTLTITAYPLSIEMDNNVQVYEVDINTKRDEYMQLYPLYSLMFKLMGNEFDMKFYYKEIQSPHSRYAKTLTQIYLNNGTVKLQYQYKGTVK